MTKKAFLNLCQLENIYIYEQLALEEALLRAGDGNWCIINSGSPPAIVMGISGKPQELIDFTHYQKYPVPIIRRFSGGGTVFIDEETLFVTFIFEKKALSIQSCPQMLLHWTKTIYEPLFGSRKFQIHENDYCIEEKKIGGNAQYFTKDRLLHHSTFLYSFTPEKMKVLTLPPKMPAYRQNRSHEHFLGTLESHFESKNHFIDDLVSELNKQFQVTKVSFTETSPLLSRPHRKSLSYVLLT